MNFSVTKYLVKKFVFFYIYNVDLDMVYLRVGSGSACRGSEFRDEQRIKIGHNILDITYLGTQQVQIMPPLQRSMGLLPPNMQVVARLHSYSAPLYLESNVKTIGDMI